MISGQNLLSNGDFQSGDNDWTKETGWSIIDLSENNWVAHCDGTQLGSTNIYQVTGFNFTGNVSLEIRFSISNYKTGTVAVVPGGDKSGTPRSANGTYTEIFNVPTGNDAFYIRADESFIGDIHNVSVVQAVITVTSPNGGETWDKGSAFPITWVDDFPEDVKIDLINGAGFVSNITTSTPSDGSYQWTPSVSLPNGSDYRIVITNVSNALVTDMSDADFSLYTPTITVISPNDGENWQAGNIHEITWTDDYSSNVKIQLYKGISFNSLIVNSTASDGSYLWDIPIGTAEASNYTIKITSIATSDIADFSDANFRIFSLDELTITSPNGGENWTAGTLQEITWTGTTSGNVKLELYDEDDFDSEIVGSTPNSGSYSWNIPIDQSQGTDYIVKIMSINHSNRHDMSDGDFKITEPKINVTSPNGGETWQAGTTHEITWTAPFTGNVKIKLYDDGDFDSEIAASIPNSGSYFWDIPTDQSPGTEYKVKIISVDDDDIDDKSDDEFTITPIPLDFKVDFLVFDNCKHKQNLSFGTAPGATDCFDPPFDRYAAPPPPSGIFDAVFVSCNDRFKKDIRATNLDDVRIWDVEYQRASSCIDDLIHFSWDPAQLPTEGNFHLVDFQTGGSLVNVDMRTTNSYTDTDDLNHLQIIFNYSTIFSIDIDEGWNMISLPLEVVSNFYLDLFPNAISNTLFGFDEMYILTDSLIPGEGYWLRFDSSETVTFEGTEIPMLKLSLKLGWNMIGGPACVFPLVVVSDPDTIIVPNTLFGFNGVYYLADSFIPGEGYWIRANSSGTITLDCESLLLPLANLPKTMNSNTDLTGFITIDLEDNKGNIQRLYFAGNLREGRSVENYSLPPVPPSGLFDARISGGYRLSESDEIDINIQAENFPLRLRMTGTNERSKDGYLLKEYVSNVEAGKREFSDGIELLITNANVNQLKIQLGSIKPSGFVLEQNHPNPFNPTTIIKYQLPYKANVKLQIINSIGQEITTLVNEEKSAGYYEVEFDGSNLASGIYFYRLLAVAPSSKSEQVFEVAKKMILMK